MRNRFAILLACALTVLCDASCLAGPALAAKDHGTTTTSMSSAKHATTHYHRVRRPAHHRKTAHHSNTPTRHTSTAGGKASLARATEVLDECSGKGQLTQDFSRAELKKALAIMSSETSQYTNCTVVIDTALVHGTKASDVTDGGSGSSSSSTATIAIIVVVVLLLLAAIFGGLAVRRRRGGGGGGDGGVPAPSSS